MGLDQTFVGRTEYFRGGKLIASEEVVGSYRKDWTLHRIIVAVMQVDALPGAPVPMTKHDLYNTIKMLKLLGWAYTEHGVDDPEPTAFVCTDTLYAVIDWMTLAEMGTERTVTYRASW